jgi:hypothetical protein
VAVAAASQASRPPLLNAFIKASHRMDQNGLNDSGPFAVKALLSSEAVYRWPWPWQPLVRLLGRPSLLCSSKQAIESNGSKRSERFRSVRGEGFVVQRSGVSMAVAMAAASQASWSPLLTVFVKASHRMDPNGRNQYIPADQQFPGSSKRATSWIETVRTIMVRSRQKLRC